MLNIIIDNLSRLEVLSRHLSSVIQIGIILLWIFLTRKSKNGYKTSSLISFFLLLLAIVVLALNFTPLAKTIGEYAFLFLGIGIIQMLIAKD